MDRAQRRIEDGREWFETLQDWPQTTLNEPWEDRR